MKATLLARRLPEPAQLLELLVDGGGDREAEVVVGHEAGGLERRAERGGHGGALGGAGAEPELDGLALEGAAVVGGDGVAQEGEVDGAAEVRVRVLHGLLGGAAELGAPEADAVDGAERARELVAEALELRVVEGGSGAGLEAAQLLAEEGAVPGGAAELGEPPAELAAEGGGGKGLGGARGGKGPGGARGGKGPGGARGGGGRCGGGRGRCGRGRGLSHCDCLAAGVREALHEREQVSGREGGEDAALSLERTELAAAVGVDGVVEAVVVVAAAGGEEVEGPLPLLEGVAAARAAALGRERRRSVVLLWLHCAPAEFRCWGKCVTRDQNFKEHAQVPHGRVHAAPFGVQYEKDRQKWFNFVHELNDLWNERPDNKIRYNYGYKTRGRVWGGWPQSR